MHDAAQSAVTALTGSSTETVGQFTYTVPTDTWWWSTSLYRMHGFTTGEIRAHHRVDDTPSTSGDQAGAVELITAEALQRNRYVRDIASWTHSNESTRWSPSARVSGTPTAMSCRSAVTSSM